MFVNFMCKLSFGLKLKPLILKLLYLIIYKRSECNGFSLGFSMQWDALLCHLILIAILVVCLGRHLRRPHFSFSSFLSFLFLFLIIFLSILSFLLPSFFPSPFFSSPFLSFFFPFFTSFLSYPFLSLFLSLFPPFFCSLGWVWEPCPLPSLVFPQE